VQIGSLVRYMDAEGFADHAIGIVTSMPFAQGSLNLPWVVGVLWSTGYDEVPIENLEVISGAG